MSKWTVTLSCKCSEGKDQVPGKNLFAVDGGLWGPSVMGPEDWGGANQETKWEDDYFRQREQRVWKWKLGGLWDSRLASEVRVGWRLWLVWAAARPLEASGRVNKLGFYLKLGGWGSYARALLENDWSICIFQEYVGCLVDAGLGEDRSGSGQLGSWSLVDETQQKGRNCWF